MKITAIVAAEPFASLFDIDPETLETLTESMRVEGFRADYPVAIWRRAGDSVLVDGYTRIAAAQAVGITEIPTLDIVVAEDDESGAVEWATRNQLTRRNLSAEQRRRAQARAFPLVDRPKRDGRPDVETSSREEVSGLSSLRTASILGVSRATVDRLRAIHAKDAAGALKYPALVDRVLDGEPVEPVYRAIPTPVAPKLYTVEAWTALTSARRRKVIADALKPKPSDEPRPSFNRQSNESIDWALWSWNPVTGCLHNCDYCYARDIAQRFYTEVSDNPGERFAPVFHPDRLLAAANTSPGSSDRHGRDKNVFVCSMADLFGKWVPQEWIEAVFDQVKAHPEWRFLFLTKFPQRLAELAWPDNAWCGTTVDRQDRVKVAEKAFRGVKAGVPWLSCEPMLEPLKFSSLEMFRHLVIGASTPSSQTPEFQPPAEWVRDLWEQADRAGCTVYLKRNLRCISDLPE